MSLGGKIKKLREASGLSQEQMADRICVSKSTYGRIERGEVALTERKLEKIANSFNIDDWSKLKSCSEDRIVFLLAENNSIEHGNLEQAETMNIHYHGNEVLQVEIEKLKLMIKHRDEMLLQKEIENQLLREIIDNLKDK